MNKELLNLIPERYLCPYCGEWHEFTGDNNLDYYDSANYCIRLQCTYNSQHATMFYFQNDTCYYKTNKTCSYYANFELKGEIPISNIIESPDEPKVKFEVSFRAANKVGRIFCEDCSSCRKGCQLPVLGKEAGRINLKIPFGFEFDESEYEEISTQYILAKKEKELEEKEKSIKEREEKIEKMEKELEKKGNVVKKHDEQYEAMKKSMEEGNMTKTSIRKQLWEKSPKENLEVVKEFADKYRPVLKWAVPVVSIYAAYKILNSKKGINISNIGEVCEDKLGFKLEFLEDKKALKQLMALGGITAGAYAAVNAISAFKANDGNKDITMEEVEDGMQKLEGVSKEFSWLQPKTEAMLPIALSVITVFVISQKPKLPDKIKEKFHNVFEDMEAKISLYSELASAFVKEKFGVDLSDEEEKQKIKKFVILAGIITVGVLLYGKKVLNNKNEDLLPWEKEDDTVVEKMHAYVKQVLPIMKKLAPSAFSVIISALVAKKIFVDDEDIIEGGYKELETPTTDISKTEEVVTSEVVPEDADTDELQDTMEE